MKKVILASVLAVAAVGSVNAAPTYTACTANGTVSAATTSATGFVKVPFSPKCSANVTLYGEDGGTFYRTGAWSTKGKTAFAGSSAGGGVAGTLCAATPCAASDATTAMAAAASS